MGLIIVELTVNVNIAAIPKESSASNRICRNLLNCDSEVCPHTYVIWLAWVSILRLGSWDGAGSFLFS